MHTVAHWHVHWVEVRKIEERKRERKVRTRHIVKHREEYVTNDSWQEVKHLSNEGSRQFIPEIYDETPKEEWVESWVETVPDRGDGEADQGSEYIRTLSTLCLEHA